MSPIAQAGVKVSRITSREQVADLPKGLSFYDPIIPHETKQALEAGSEVYVSTDMEGSKNGLLIYDRFEATGTIFAKSREVFDAFYELKPSSYIFSEVDASDLPREPWNIWQLDVDKAALDHTYRHRVSIDHDASEIERFMAGAMPETNPKWVRVALGNGDKCFVVKVGERIVGMAWMSIAGGMARSHGLYVEPPFRRKGVMKDNLHARLIYLKTRHIHTLVNEIAESNDPSSAHAAKAGEKIVGKLFLYTTPDSKP